MSAQLEDGYTRIANELLDNLVKLYLNGNEWKIVHCVMRQTWGWRKKADRISLTQFTEHTGLNRSTVNKIVKSLVAKQILVAKQQPSGNEYQIQKDQSKWTSCRIDTSCRFATTPVAKQQPVATSSEVVAIQQPTKEIKENIQKKAEDFVSLLNWWNTKYKTSYRTNPPNKKYLEIFSRWIENGGNIQDIKVAKVLSEHNPRWGKGIGIDSLLRSGKTKDADWVEHFINFEGYEGEAKKFQQEYLSSRNKEV